MTPARPLPTAVGLRRAERLARHAWGDGARLDLYSDIERSADAIGGFAGAARGATAIAGSATAPQAIYETLRDAFIRASRTGPLGLAARVGLAGLPDLMRISPFTSLWRALGGLFRRSAPAPALRPLCDLLRLIALPRARRR